MSLIQKCFTESGVRVSVCVSLGDGLPGWVVGLGEE